MSVNQYLGSNLETDYDNDPFIRLCQRIRVEQDWHEQVFATDPPCLPHQWRCWDRNVVEAIIFLKLDMLKSAHDWCHDHHNKRSRLSAIEQELIRYRVSFQPIK